MTPAEIIAYVGPALLYAAILTLVLTGLATLIGKRIGWIGMLSLYPMGLFVALTQHPFPDPATLTCPVAGVEPIWRPLTILDHVWRLRLEQAPLSAWIGDRSIQAAAMNYGLCVLVGVGFARFLSRLATAVLTGFLLSLTVEVSQLTAYFGLYPCAVRQFDVDDLLFNTLGVATGYLLFCALKKNRVQSAT